jgi:NTP pyrophosphatase (non-canonical NTP hydrolase)
MNNIKYSIYHIPGKKIGVTCDLYNRLTKQQGYKDDEYEVLLSSNDINIVSKLERELQLIYGYKVDRDSYKELITSKKNKKKKCMVLNVTEQTTTFPSPINKLKGNLLDNLGMTIQTPFNNYILDLDLVYWIMSNVKTSMYNPSRSYVYNKAMDEFWKSRKSVAQVEQNENKEENPNVYDLIRQWADDRGIYRDGDSKTQYVKLMEEAGELAKALLKNDKEETIDAIGDMIVVLTNLAALEGLKVEDCITSAYDVIKKRKGKMENGTFVKEVNEHLKSTL